MSEQQDYIDNHLQPLIDIQDANIAQVQQRIDFFSNVDISTVTTREQLAALHTAEFGVQDEENGNDFVWELYYTWTDDEGNPVNWEPDATHVNANLDYARHESVEHYCQRMTALYTSEKANFETHKTLLVAKKDVYLQIEAGTWDGTSYPTPA